MTEWHLRYGGKGVMIYSQLKTCSSSEVAAMIKGVLEILSHKDRLLLKGLLTEQAAVSLLTGKALLEQARYLFLTLHLSVPAFQLDWPSSRPTFLLVQEQNQDL